MSSKNSIRNENWNCLWQWTPPPQRREKWEKNDPPPKKINFYHVIEKFQYVKKTEIAYGNGHPHLKEEKKWEKNPTNWFPTNKMNKKPPDGWDSVVVWEGVLKS